MAGRWSEEKRELVRQCWKDGLSANETELKTGISRNSVIGFWNREGLGGDHKNDPAVIAERKAKAAAAAKSRVYDYNKKRHVLKSDGVVMEPWTEFHARKKKEREALKAKGAFYIYQSAGRKPGK